MKLIRKISIGRDYKNDAMHYATGQEVYGGHTISDIKESEFAYDIYICLLYTSPSPRDATLSRMPSSA